MPRDDEGFRLSAQPPVLVRYPRARDARACHEIDAAASAGLAPAWPLSTYERLCSPYRFTAGRLLRVAVTPGLPLAGLLAYRILSTALTVDRLAVHRDADPLAVGEALLDVVRGRLTRKRPRLLLLARLQNRPLLRFLCGTGLFEWGVEHDACLDPPDDGVLFMHDAFAGPYPAGMRRPELADEQPEDAGEVPGGDGGGHHPWES